MRSFVKKTGMPEGSERQANEHQWSPLEKLRLPSRGRILLIPKKPFEANHEKAFLGRDEFFQRIFLHKSQAWVIVGG